MSSNKYQLTYSNTSDVFEWDANTILNKINEADAAVRSIFSHNDQIDTYRYLQPKDVTDKSLYYMQCHVYGKTARAFYGNSIYKVDLVRSDYRGGYYFNDRHDAALQRVLTYNAVVRDKLTKGRKLTKSDNFIALLDDVNDKYKFVCVSRPKPKVTCAACGVTVNLSQIDKHKVTLACANAAKTKQLIEKNYRTVAYKSKLYNAAVADKVPGAILTPVRYDVWIPQWMHEAVELYEKHDKYAGLDLVDFINRMGEVKPDADS